MDRLIQADTLLVLVNHPSPAVQQEVIKVRANTKYVALIWKNSQKAILMLISPVRADLSLINEMKVPNNASW